MSVVNITKHAKAPIQTAQHVRNGKYPAAELQNLIAERAGAAAWTRPQLVYRSPGFIIGTAGAALIPSSTSGTRVRWRFPLHSGPFAQYLQVNFQMAPQNNVGAPTDPIGQLQIYSDSTETTLVGTARMHWGSSAGGYADTPINFGGGTTTLVDSNDALVALTPLTQYFGRISDVDYARIQSVVVWEYPLEPTTANGYAANNVGAGSPIFDEDRADPADMGKRLWAYGAQPLWHWSVDTDAGARTQSNGDLSGSLVQTISPFTLAATGTVATTAPAFQAVTTFQTSTSPTMVMSWPTVEVGDVAFLVVVGPSVGSGQYPYTSGSDWTTLQSAVNTHTFWARADDPDMDDVTITFQAGEGQLCGAAMIIIRGCVSSGSPIDVFDWLQVPDPGSTSVTIATGGAGAVTNVANTLLLGIVGGPTATSFSGWAHSVGSGATERLDSNGGSALCIGIATATHATAAAMGKFTATAADTTQQALFHYALKP